ncbi:NAD(P)H-quinone oxidoreductase subunit S, chloroplastic-like [Rutidosis leptorrhynchoides]|uniref:NAD(P)H-quinone oxidoreductase subunit S, chloroplastic-like n=1 Tax=Rutidosis leptorrhynchoides TaxID=125765 RepID=UPI003A99709E
MATSFNLPTFQLHKSHFLGHTNFIHKSSSFFPTPKQSSHQIIIPRAKFNLYEILGGRGLLGEEGLQEELKKSPPPPPQPQEQTNTTNDQENVDVTINLPENGFDKELLGLTGGFPGGEKGLQDFIEKNPPPKKSPPKSSSSTTAGFDQKLVRKPKAPELPLLMPGMIAIVKNPNSPYHMYCGIVQRITDGKAGVLFEGGNWDRLITFKLNELERREKGPPMVSPRSVVLEDLVEKSTN